MARRMADADVAYQCLPGMLFCAAHCARWRPRRRTERPARPALLFARPRQAGVLEAAHRVLSFVRPVGARHRAGGRAAPERWASSRRVHAGACSFGACGWPRRRCSPPSTSRPPRCASAACARDPRCSRPRVSRSQLAAPARAPSPTRRSAGAAPPRLSTRRPRRLAHASASRRSSSPARHRPAAGQAHRDRRRDQRTRPAHERARHPQPRQDRPRQSNRHVHCAFWLVANTIATVLDMGPTFETHPVWLDLLERAAAGVQNASPVASPRRCGNGGADRRRQPAAPPLRGGRHRRQRGVPAEHGVHGHRRRARRRSCGRTGSSSCWTR